MMAATLYITAAVLIAQVTPQLRVKLLILQVSAFLVAAVGASRVYLGVHWPSDVVAGWLAGAVWASTCLLGRWQFTHGRRAFSVERN